MQIAISRPGGIGDALLLVPALRALRADYPDIRIALHAQRPAMEWLRAHRFIDIPLYSDRMPQGMDALIGFGPNPPAWRKAHYHHRAGSVLACPSIHSPGTHMARWQYEQVKRAVPIWAPYDDSPVVPQDRTPGLDEAVILATGASCEEKIWPHWERLAEELTRRGRRVIVADPQPPAWAERYERVPAGWMTLESWVAGSALLIGNDSAPAHVGGLMNHPTLVLFGPTVPAHWAPLGQRTTVLHGCPTLRGRSDTARVIACRSGDCWDGLPLERVLDAMSSPGNP